MSSPRFGNPKQVCEHLLFDAKRYNIEHSILRSEVAVADRLLARSLELADAYDELYKSSTHTRVRCRPSSGSS
ncbi:hypothetical protein ACU4GI_11005 [Cupriavidus basilensis]